MGDANTGIIEANLGSGLVCSPFSFVWLRNPIKPLRPNSLFTLIVFVFPFICFAVRVCWNVSGCLRVWCLRGFEFVYFLGAFFHLVH
jgi:hypothetical protein